VVRFATEQMEAGKDPLAGRRCQAGFTPPFSAPVLMDKLLAMIIGMMPMALGMGDGGEGECPAWPRP